MTDFKTLKGYRIVRKIGSGYKGDVRLAYKVEDPSTAIAIKIFKESLTEEEAAKVLEEVKI